MLWPDVRGSKELWIFPGSSHMVSLSLMVTAFTSEYSARAYSPLKGQAQHMRDILVQSTSVELEIMKY